MAAVYKKRRAYRMKTEKSSGKRIIFIAVLSAAVFVVLKNREIRVWCGMRAAHPYTGKTEDKAIPRRHKYM